MDKCKHKPRIFNALDGTQLEDQIVAVFDQNYHYPSTYIQTQIQRLKANQSFSVVGCNQGIVHDLSTRLNYKYSYSWVNCTNKGNIVFNTNTTPQSIWEFIFFKTNTAVGNLSEDIIASKQISILQSPPEEAAIRICNGELQLKKAMVLTDNHENSDLERYYEKVPSLTFFSNNTEIRNYNLEIISISENDTDNILQRYKKTQRVSPTRIPQPVSTPKTLVDKFYQFVMSIPNIAIYTDTDIKIVHEGITIMPWQHFDYQKKHNVVIVSGCLSMACTFLYGLKANKIFVNFESGDHNIKGQHIKELLNKQKDISGVIVKSEYQKRLVAKMFTEEGLQEFEQKIIMLPDSIDRGIVETSMSSYMLGTDRDNNERLRDPYRLCCMFNDTEMLKVIGEIFKNLRSIIPTVELHVITDMKISYIEGVMVHSGWGLKELIKEFKHSSCFVYFSEDENEMSNLHLQYAIACGCIPIILHKGYYQRIPGLSFEVRIDAQQSLIFIIKQMLELLLKKENMKTVRDKILQIQIATNQEASEYIKEILKV